MLNSWDVDTGRLIRSFQAGNIGATAFSPSGRQVVTGTDDNKIKLWDQVTSKLLVSLVAGGGENWIALTPHGFFTTGQTGQIFLHIVRGTQVTAISQVQQSLFNPDLVRETLAGDPNDEALKAASVLNLGKVLESGPAPQVAITTYFNESRLILLR